MVRQRRQIDTECATEKTSGRAGTGSKDNQVYYLEGETDGERRQHTPDRTTDRPTIYEILQFKPSEGRASKPQYVRRAGGKFLLSAVSIEPDTSSGYPGSRHVVYDQGYPKTTTYIHMIRRVRLKPCGRESSLHTIQKTVYRGCFASARGRSIYIYIGEIHHRKHHYIGRAHWPKGRRRCTVIWPRSFTVHRLLSTCIRTQVGFHRLLGNIYIQGSPFSDVKNINRCAHRTLATPTPISI